VTTGLSDPDNFDRDDAEWFGENDPKQPRPLLYDDEASVERLREKIHEVWGWCAPDDNPDDPVCRGGLCELSRSTERRLTVQTGCPHHDKPLVTPSICKCGLAKSYHGFPARKPLAPLDEYEPRHGPAHRVDGVLVECGL
jgi:hypothetical protein